MKEAEYVLHSSPSRQLSSLLLQILLFLSISIRIKDLYITTY